MQGPRTCCRPSIPHGVYDYYHAHTEVLVVFRRFQIGTCLINLYWVGYFLVHRLGDFSSEFELLKFMDFRSAQFLRITYDPIIALRDSGTFHIYRHVHAIYFLRCGEHVCWSQYFRGYLHLLFRSISFVISEL